MGKTLAVLLGGLAMATILVAAGDDKVQKFSGSYDWRDGGSDELTAEFKPSGDGSWDVKFSFRWNGDRRSWKGTAEGSLDDGGKISGTSGKSGRTWEFEGAVEGGTLRGSHTEFRRSGKRYDTGSFELTR